MTLLSANSAEFVINLVGTDSGQDARLIDTGAHRAFSFNYNGPGNLSFSDFQANGSPSSIYSGEPAGTYNNSPYGTFNYAVSSTCTSGSLTGACASAGNVVRFVVTSTVNFANGLGDLINLSPNGTRVYFAADIFYSGGGGQTGVVGVTGDPSITINSVPEPQSAALLGTGLIGLAFAAKRMRRR